MVSWSLFNNFLESSAPASSCHHVCVFVGYRHVYLEGMEEASIFVHVAVNDITGKVGTEGLGHHLNMASLL